MAFGWKCKKNGRLNVKTEPPITSYDIQGNALGGNGYVHIFDRTNLRVQKMHKVHPFSNQAARTECDKGLMKVEVHDAHRRRDDGNRRKGGMKI